MEQKDFNILTKPNIKVIHKEAVSVDTIVKLAVFKKCLPVDELPKGVSTAICSVYVELMNNIRMHAAIRKEANAPLGVLLLGEDETSYYLQSANAIKDEKVETLEKQLKRMNNHIKKELRKYYKYRRRFDNPNPESTGAGLGLIEIAKRTKEPIEYSFKEFDKGLSFFMMLVKFNKGGK